MIYCLLQCIWYIAISSSFGWSPPFNMFHAAEASVYTQALLLVVLHHASCCRYIGYPGSSVIKEEFIFFLAFSLSIRKLKIGLILMQNISFRELIWRPQTIPVISHLQPCQMWGGLICQESWRCQEQLLLIYHVQSGFNQSIVDSQG